MGGNASGALNTAGFSASIRANRLPNAQHITHAGIFNEKYFQVGEKSKDLLSLHHGIGVSNCDLFDLPKRNYFISVFMKSSADGEKRIRPINVCFGLDISGSMGGPLTYDGPYDKAEGKKNRLQLSQDAIWMFYQKLNPDDIFSFIVFHNESRTVIKSEFVKNLDSETVKEFIYQKFESGGTTIKTGFNEAVKNITEIRKNNVLQNYEHRIVMLTDVNDNSVQNQNILIEDISTQNKIGTTIIGVSSDFRSETCQKLTTVRGFNYFCAVEDKDLQTFLVQRFDYTFFPCVQDVQIKLQTKQIKNIKVYGSPDYRAKYAKQENDFVVTKMKSGFPSQIQYNKTKKLQTLGGLILVKFFPTQEEQLPKQNLVLKLSYRDMDGKKFEQQYEIKMDFQAEEYYSDSACRQGVQLFYYAETMRNLLESMNQKLSDETRNMYLQKLNKLKEYCPVEKKQDLQKVISIVQQKQSN